MSTVTVLLVPDGPAAGVPDALADLSAAGLLDRFAVVTASQMMSPGIGATELRDGRRTGVSLAHWINEQSGGGDARRVRMVVVVPLGGDETVPQHLEQQLYDLVNSGGGAGAITPIRCLVARPGAQAPSDVVARSGWHNVLVSPEDAEGPGTFRVDLWSTGDRVDIGRYAGPVVAGVAALWTGVDHCPLDGMVPPADRRVRAARAFFRRVDADAIESELRATVLATGESLPLPRDHMGATVYVDDRRLACSQMADELWRLHRDKLIGPRETPAKTPALPTGAWAAIKMLLEYIWAALLKAPGAWLEGKRNQAAEAAARRTHQMVFGDGEVDREVVVRGIDRPGLPASWRDLGDAYRQVDDRLAGSADRHRVRPDLREMWNDYVAGALTLVDAGTHGNMPPATVGGNRAIVRSVADCAPDPSHDFTAIPPHVADVTGAQDGILPGDVLETISLSQKLASPRLAADFGADAGKTSQALTEWAERHDGTYSVQVGHRLAAAVFGMIAEIRGYLDLLYRIGQEQNRPPETGGRPRWILWVLSVLAVAGLVAGPILGTRGTVNTATAWLIAVVPAVVWVIYVLLEFAKARREAFRDEHRRRTLLDSATAARMNLGQAIVDLERLSDAYEQYLVWSRILGVVLRRPFGVPADAAPPVPGLARGLPLSTGIARAAVDEAPLGRTVAALRSQVYFRGWLGTLWEEHVNGAAARLRDYDLMARRPGDILDLRGVAIGDSALSRWARLLREQDSDPRVGDLVWANVVGGLDHRPEGLGGNLLSAVQGTQDSGRTPSDLQRFMAGIDRDRAGSQERFTNTIFTSTALAQEHAKIAIHDPRQCPLGLSRVATLVQMGEPWPPEDFAVTATKGQEPQGRVTVPPMPGAPAPRRGDSAGSRSPAPAEPDVATPPTGVPATNGSAPIPPGAAPRRAGPPPGPPGFG